MNLVTDTHIHILNHLITPRMIYADRKDIDLGELNFILEFLEKYDTLEKGLEEVYNIFASKNIHLTTLLDNYLNDIEDVINNIEQKLERNGILRAFILNIRYDIKEKSPVMTDHIFDRLKASKTIDFKWFEGIYIEEEQMYYNKERMKKADGIKLYLPLNWVHNYALFQVAQLKKPIISHASKGGIGRFSENANPILWDQVLTFFPNIKICFAHFNNTFEYLSDAFDLDFDYDGIYHDVAFNDKAMTKPDRYFKYLKDMLSQGHKIMFGSDYPLQTVYYTYSDYVNQFKKHLTDDEFELMFKIYPSQFLGE